jgi:hypothetical protein
LEGGREAEFLQLIGVFEGAVVTTAAAVMCVETVKPALGVNGVLKWHGYLHSFGSTNSR